MSSSRTTTLHTLPGQKAQAKWCAMSASLSTLGGRGLEAGLRQDSRKYFPATSVITFANPEVGE